MRILFNLVLVMLALATALVSGMPAVRAQVYISNTAYAQFGYPGSVTVKPSNTVETEYKTTATLLSVLREAPAGGGTQLKFRGSICGASANAVTDAANEEDTVKSLTETSFIRKGEAVFFRVTDPSLNKNISSRDNVYITVTSSSGDSENVIIRETGPSTGVFVGSIRSSFADSAREADCRILTKPGDKLIVTAARVDSPDAPLVRATVDVSLDPVGYVFDSAKGTPLDGVKVSLVDAVTGKPARVYAEDGTTPWPSTVISGESIVDAGGVPHSSKRGEYRFPVIPTGLYKLIIEPPSPLVAPSVVPLGSLATFKRSDGTPVFLSEASFGRTFEVKGIEGLQVDIPVDQPAGSVSIDMSSSKANALPGDLVMFTVNLRNQSQLPASLVKLVNTPSSQFRFRPDTVRIDGKKPGEGVIQFAPDGKSMTINVALLAPGNSARITYAMSVRPDANAGQAFNRATVAAYGGPQATAGTYVKIEREDITSRTTFLGRVIAGACTTSGKGIGIPGVRVMMEDGSFSITDSDGRYRFDGVVPGNHVLQVAPSTLPEGGRFVDCAQSTRSAGSAISRFVSGQGGNVSVANFHAEIPETALKSIEDAAMAANNAVSTVDADVDAGSTDAGDEATPRLTDDQMSRLTNDERRKIDDDDTRRAAGGTTDWMKVGAGPTEILFPAENHNPRAPAVRVVVRHQPNETVELQSEGKQVDAVTLDSYGVAENGAYAISIWRGIPLEGEDTRLTAVIRDASGTVVKTVTRDVHFANVPAKVEFVREKSVLVADGKTKPVLALRILDRFGKPLHSGLTGDFTLSSPYESAEVVSSRQSRSISGLDQLGTRWFIKGDDGIAFVELAPTMVSGKVQMAFQFTNGTQKRRQELETWIEPGKVDWTVVGLAEAGAGSRDIATSMQRNNSFSSDLGGQCSYSPLSARSDCKRAAGHRYVRQRQTARRSDLARQG